MTQKRKKPCGIYIVCLLGERERDGWNPLLFYKDTILPRVVCFFLKWIMIGRSSNVRPLPQAEIFQIILPIPKISIVLPTLQRSKECRSRSSLQIRVWDEK